MSVREFVRKNLVLMVMVPFIIGSHYGWYKLQEVDALVSAEERDKLIFKSIVKKAEIAQKPEILQKQNGTEAQ